MQTNSKGKSTQVALIRVDSGRMIGVDNQHIDNYLATKRYRLAIEEDLVGYKELYGFKPELELVQPNTPEPELTDTNKSSKVHKPEVKND